MFFWFVSIFYFKTQKIKGFVYFLSLQQVEKLLNLLNKT